MANRGNLNTFRTLIVATVFCWSFVASSMATAQTTAPTGEQPAAGAPAPTSEQSAVETSAAPVPAAMPMAMPAAPAPPPGPPQSLIADGEAPKGPIAPAFPPAIPSADFGARMRGGLKVQNTSAPDKLNDFGEQWDADLMMSGQIHRYFKWVASVTLSYSGTAGASNSVNVQPCDVFAHFAAAPEFNIMMGRMLVIADRFSPGGPWGLDEFVFAGFFPLVGAPALPKAGPTGRDVGTTVWGAPLGGYTKYYLGVFNLNDPASRPLYTGRLQVNLIGPEPAFNHPATYYGAKDIVSVGVGGQYQKEGSTFTDSTTTPPTVLKDNYKYVTGDLTAEKTVSGVGTLSAIGGFSKYWGQYQPWKHSYLVSLGYMLPQNIGFGKPRVTVRYQGGKSPAADAKTSYVIDAQLGYSVHARFTHLMLGYRRGDTWTSLAAGTPRDMHASNMVYFGIQLWDP